MPTTITIATNDKGDSIVYDNSDKDFPFKSVFADGLVYRTMSLLDSANDISGLTNEDLVDQMNDTLAALSQDLTEACDDDESVEVVSAILAKIAAVDECKGNVNSWA